MLAPLPNAKTITMLGRVRLVKVEVWPAPRRAFSKGVIKMENFWFMKKLEMVVEAVVWNPLSCRLSIWEVVLRWIHVLKKI